MLLAEDRDVQQVGDALVDERGEEVLTDHAVAHDDQAKTVRAAHVEFHAEQPTPAVLHPRAAPVISV